MPYIIIIFLHSGWLSGLCKVWDYDKEYEKALRAMGYGTTKLPFDFSLREFDVDNGCGGRMPVTMKEWIRVGVWRANISNSSASSDQKAYCLMKFLYNLNTKSYYLKYQVAR